jgi:hypothetical protein
MRTRQAKQVLLFALVLSCVMFRPALAQVIPDIDGGWQAIFHEDQLERVPGPELGDYLGLPINAAARAFGEAWSASRLTIPEHQCRAHSSAYIYRGPLNLRIWSERDPNTQQIIAIHQDTSNFQQRRVIWMDGRPHPPEDAAHTWMGFSTGRWEGDMLVVTTTHIKQMWHRRNGLPQSDKIRLTEYFIRHGAVMTYVTHTEDPVYLTEPLVKTTNLRLSQIYLTPQQLLYPCQNVVELASLERGQVPHYMPGENPFLRAFRDRFKLPEIATRGGAETMYPEFRRRVDAAVGVPSAAAVSR